MAETPADAPFSRCGFGGNLYRITCGCRMFFTPQCRVGFDTLNAMISAHPTQSAQSPGNVAG
ncbi:MAG: hypothetical protein ACYCOR_10530 [Acidobacteriaceae bacterium]